MTERADVSVVIPVRDGERHICAAIESVLGGTHSPAEVVVVDAGSEDSSGAVAAACDERVRVLRQDRAGVAAAVNRGLADTRCGFVSFIDADDLWTAEKLESQIGSLAADSELDAVFGHVVEFHSDDLTAEERDEITLHTDPRPARVRGTMLARRELFERAGPFDESLRLGEFVDWYSRAERRGFSSLMLERVVLKRRLHARNLGRTSPAGDRLDYVRVARDALQRRRMDKRMES